MSRRVASASAWNTRSASSLSAIYNHMVVDLPLVRRCGNGVTASLGGERQERRDVSRVALTHLDDPLFDDAGATKRDLVDYLDGVRDLIIPALEDRPLSVIRVHRGQRPFMQKNVPKYTPEWVRTVTLWAVDVEARGVVRAVQRPPHAGVVRQPARGRIPPVTHASRTP